MYKEQMRVVILTDEHFITYQIFKRDTSYDGTKVSNQFKTIFDRNQSV